MNLGRFLLLAGVLLMAVCGIARSGEGGWERGPCYGSSSAWVPPPHCEYDCWFVCWDQYSPVTTTAGYCGNTNQDDCRTVIATYPKNIRRDCDCPLGGGLCVDAGLFNDGEQDVKHCQGTPGA